MRSEPARSPAAPLPPAAAIRDGARREILAAVTALLARTSASDVSLTDIVEEMHRRGTGYADSTIRTMVTAHLCAEATGPGARSLRSREGPGQELDDLVGVPSVVA
jgi:hypothetical protein